MVKNKIYTHCIRGTVLPGITQLFLMTLNDQNREFMIRSVSFDIHIMNNAAPGAPLNLNTQTTQMFLLFIGALAGDIKIAKLIDSPPVAGYAQYPGQVIFITRPGQLLFNSFYVWNEIPIRFEYYNTDLIETYYFTMTLTIETNNQ
jgi:branched-subunit amino acid aminotransferase/4-amino-4-deoxychorismate lyase